MSFQEIVETVRKCTRSAHNETDIVCHTCYWNQMERKSKDSKW